MKDKEQSPYRVHSCANIKERVTFDFSVDTTNPFKFVRWINPTFNAAAPPAGLDVLSTAFGAITQAADGRTLQINGAIKF